MRKRGRPPVLDKDKKREILAILSVGGSQRMAAAYVGCAHTTIRRTADRDPAFGENFRHALIEPEIRYLKRIQSAATEKKYWRAAAWALERLNPTDFSPPGVAQVAIEMANDLLAQVAQIVVEEVRVARYRTNILKRIDELIDGLTLPALEDSARLDSPGNAGEDPKR